MNNMRAMFLLIAFSVMASEGPADVIYNVDFENPPHIVDQQIVVGSGSDRPQFADTSVIVRDSPADFTTQAASLEPAGAMTLSPGITFSEGLENSGRLNNTCVFRCSAIQNL